MVGKRLVKIKKMKSIGIIGMSEGNAHPYSWSSIINGKYNYQSIADAGYPAVSAYLKANEDSLGINGYEVTHIYTQDKSLSKSIAESSGIRRIVEKPEDMIGEIDALILARDDAQSHIGFVKPFMEAGIPVFIDKPLAISREALNWFEQQHKKGRFFMSCSAMRFSSECKILKQDISSLGNTELVIAVGKKDWLKYGVHMVEAVLATLDDAKVISVQNIGEKGKDIVKLNFESGLTACICLYMDIYGTFQFQWYGSQAGRVADIKNSYSMFRETILQFFRSMEEGQPRISFEKTYQVIETVIAAEESRLNGGVIVNLRK